MRVVTSLNFFTPSEIEQLTLSTGVTKSSTSVKRQSQLVGFLQALSSRIGFPQRTIATAQLLYLRFHLFYNPNDFLPHQVGIACLVVAAKMNDTPKKSKEVILSSWALRYPELVRSVPLTRPSNANTRANVQANLSPFSVPSSSQNGLGVISESDIDANVLEAERKRVLALESLILQSIAFDFNMRIRDNLLLTAKLARKWGADKGLGRLAWQVAADSHRTYAPLTYPPSTISAASVYTASLLSLRCTLPSMSASSIIKRFEDEAGGQAARIDKEDEALCCPIDGVEDVVHALLDLYGGAIAALPSSSSSSSGITPVSPATPASPSETLLADSSSLDPNASRKLPSHVFSPPPFGVLHWCTHGSPSSTAEMLNDLTQMKIALRRNEDQRDSLRYRAKASVTRIFDKGGIKGDVEATYDEDMEQNWQERQKDKQFSALQRFLF